jgi:YidC/Oxa1 family membrane protein insertase
MDNLRLILFFSLAFVLLMLWQAWNEDYGQKPAPQVEAHTSTETVPAGSVPNTPVMSGTSEVPTASSSPVPAPGVPSASPAAPATASKVRIETDLYTMDLDTKGGSIVNVLLNDYSVSIEQQDRKFQLMKETEPDLYIAHSGMIAAEGTKAPTHETVYQAVSENYRMADDQNELHADLVWQGEDGVKVTKRFSFTRGSYLVKVQHIVENASAKPWVAREYRQLMRTQPQDSAESQFIYTYTGGAIYSEEEKYEKISFDDMEESKLSREVKGGWIAMLQHYFLGAWVPPVEESSHFYTNVYAGKRYVLGAYSPVVSVAPGASHIFSTGFLASPKLQEELEAIAKGLDLSVDYGWLTIIAQPIFWLLKKIHGIFGNWGWSIIFLTILIKLAFYKLSEASYKSMANMRRMTPRIQALKDRYGDDKARLNSAMMEMYKKEKINPLGGCLPILVQIPVFIALYWVLLESVELRQAPFILWIEDMAVKDPYFVLPLIMGVSMFIQQKLNPAPPDPMQAKIMMSLPFVFTVFFAFFPAGLVLYWVVNNILSIAQQWYITRQIEQAAASKSKG